jgi:AcrR family transcriptional regulator
VSRAAAAGAAAEPDLSQNPVLSLSEWTAEREVTAREREQLMQAALAVMCEHPDRSPRVSDIVAGAGMSNNAFYRHFRSKDDLVLAILDDGRRTMLGYLEHLMAAEPTGVGKVRRWIEGMMAQAVDPGAAAATRAVHVNAARVDGGIGAKGRRAEADLRALLEGALRDTASRDPARDAYVVFHAVVACMTDFLGRRVVPSADDVAHLAAFCVAGLGADAAARSEVGHGA